MDTTETNLSLFKRLQLIANDIMSLEKDMKVGTGNYAYKAVSDFSVTKAVKEAELMHGVLSIPTKQDLVHQEVIKTVSKDNTEKTTYSFIIKMTVKFLNVDNPEEFIEVETFGHGLDSGDKGFGKASTYARKYALLNAYKIATGDDPDAEVSKKEETKITPSEKRIAVTNYLNQSVDKTREMCSYFNVAELSDLTEANINYVYTTYKGKGLI